MPSLTAQRMAERDAALRNGASGRSQFSRMIGRGSELEAEKLDLARDKFDAQQAQRDLSNAFRDAQMKMNTERASQQAESAKAQLELADRRIEMQQKQHLIAEESAKLRDLQAERKTDRTLEALQQGTAFLRDARGMRPEAAEFDDQLDEMLAGYPVAAEHPAVKEWLDYNQKRRGEFLAREATKKPEKETDPLKRLEHLERLRMKPNVDDDVVKYLDAEILKLRTPQSESAPAAKPAATPEEWLAANPNDPRAPAIRAKLGIK